MDEGSMRITVLGGRSVGVTTAVALAERGHDVRLVETDRSKARASASGSVPFYEPGIEEAMGDLSGKRVALLGLALKHRTSDVRETRALPIWQALVDASEAVVCHDPEAGPECQLPTSRFIHAMKQTVVIDARRHLKDTAGLRYRAIGVPAQKEVLA